jgi:hypothetical protein
MYSKLGLVRAASLLRRWLHRDSDPVQRLAQLGPDSVLIFRHFVALWWHRPESRVPIDSLVEAHVRIFETLASPILPPEKHQGAVDASAREFRDWLERADKVL